jgi:hypothetical protein
MRAASLDWQAQALAALAQFEGGRTEKSRMAALNKLELLFKGDDYQKRVLEMSRSVNKGQATGGHLSLKVGGVPRGRAPWPQTVLIC